MQHVKGYISLTGMHFVDASDYHTLIIGECDLWCGLGASRKIKQKMFIKVYYTKKVNR